RIGREQAICLFPQLRSNLSNRMASRGGERDRAVAVSRIQLAPAIARCVARHRCPLLRLDTVGRSRVARASPSLFCPPFRSRIGASRTRFCRVIIAFSQSWTSGYHRQWDQSPLVSLPLFFHSTHNNHSAPTRKLFHCLQLVCRFVVPKRSHRHVRSKEDGSYSRSHLNRGRRRY